MDKQTTAVADAILIFEKHFKVKGKKQYNKIKSELLEKERQQMQDIFKNSRTIISDCEVWNCEGSVKKYESFEQYYTETFLTN